MRAFIYLFLMTIIGCTYTTHEDNSSAGRIEPVPESHKKLQLKTEKLSEPTTSATTPINCSAKNLLKLRDNGLQYDFFRQLASIRKVQYPNNDQDTDNSVDITPSLLKKFLKDVNVDTLQKNGTYESYYFFNIAPAQYVDSKKCKDKIEIQYFNKECGFRMVIDNVYLVEKRDCIGGSQVIYGFKIVDGKIVDFTRNEAG